MIILEYHANEIGSKHSNDQKLVTYGKKKDQEAMSVSNEKQQIEEDNYGT